MSLGCRKLLSFPFSRCARLRCLVNMIKTPVSTHTERTESSFRDKGIFSAEVVELDELSNTVKGLKLKLFDQSFGFKSGQWVDFIIPGLTVVGGFSICSSPEELQRRNVIQLAVKQSEHPPAKWVHTKCQVGDKVQVRVGGDFYLDLPQHNNKKTNILFIAGGVGINPLLSMLKFSAENSALFGNISLMFSAHTMDELLFKSQIIDVCGGHPHFNCNFFISGKPRELIVDKWTQGGRITKQAIKSTLEHLDINNLQVYICGPQPMIQFISDSLEAIKVGRERIHFEKWW